MIGVLTHHWAKADKVEEAKALLDGNGLAQSKAPGFGARQTFISLSDPTKISTLVTWESNEIYDAWRPARSAPWPWPARRNCGRSRRSPSASTWWTSSAVGSGDATSRISHRQPC